MKWSVTLLFCKLYRPADSKNILHSVSALMGMPLNQSTCFVRANVVVNVV